jgi:hypothetical protein
VYAVAAAVGDALAMMISPSHLVVVVDVVLILSSKSHLSFPNASSTNSASRTFLAATSDRIIYYLAVKSSTFESRCPARVVIILFSTPPHNHHHHHYASMCGYGR